MTLPLDLKQALETEFHHVPLTEIAANATEVRSRYRRRHQRDRVSILGSRQQVLAYAAYRLPSTFAATKSALDEVRLRRPGWNPRTVLDVGSGPGTAAWAAATVWPELEHVTMLEKDENMIEFSERIRTHAEARSIREATVYPVDITAWKNVRPHDLVIAAYVLGEMPDSRRRNAVAYFWESCTDTVCIIEPAKSSPGFRIVLDAREQLIAADASMIAPCPHTLTCPKATGNRWCHFAQRVERTRVQRMVKQGFRPYEDEKFSYVAMSRANLSVAARRATLQPQLTPAGVQMEVCGPDSLETVLIPKRDKERFRQARQVRWGDVVPSDLMCCQKELVRE